MVSIGKCSDNTRYTRVTDNSAANTKRNREKEDKATGETKTQKKWRRLMRTCLIDIVKSFIISQ